LTNEIEAIEVLSKKGRETIRQLYRANTSLIEQQHNFHLTCLLGDSEKPEEPAKNGTLSTATAHSRKKSNNKSTAREQAGFKIDKCNLFNSY
jgi:hypothetical protein